MKSRFNCTKLLSGILIPILALPCLALPASATPSASPVLNCTPADDWTALFDRKGTRGWLAADGIYSVAPQKCADIKNKAEMLDLKAAFLARVHSRGGEFFEYYFLELVKRYLLRFGKTIIEGYVTGGSDDGGIDGVVRTKDSLGFIETIMIQTKNRTDTMNETDVRGFLGAVYAKRGSRGIFATISDFHPMAVRLIDSVDELVGIDGAKIFSMACDTSYGIKREGGKLVIDEEII